MNKRNKNNRRKKSILCWILAIAVMITGIPAQAAMFEPVVPADDVFTSGAVGDIFTDNADSGSIAVNPNIPETNVPEPTITPEPGVSPEPTVTPEPGVSPAPTVTPVPTETPIPTPTVVPEGTVVVKFADSTGEKYYEELETAIKWGDLLELPNVPDFTVKESNVWKLEKDKTLDNTFAFDGGENLTITQGESWEKYMEDKVLTFYAAKKCKVTLYNNSGTAVFAKGRLEAYEGEKIILPDMPSSTYINYGWTSVKSGKKEEYKLNSLYDVTDDVDLYIVRLTALNVTFLQPAGSSTSSMVKLNMRVGKSTQITMPKVPASTGYENLGWSRTKNASSASYKPGQKVTVTKELTFYAVRKKLPYTVVFNNNSGTSTSKTYTSLKMYAGKNQTVTLPEVPKATGYQNIGWTTAKGKSTPVYKAGAKVKVTKNMKFYTVRKKSKYYTVQFYLGNGSTNTAYKNLSMKVEEGTTITFPKVPARNGYINKGWASKANATVPSSKTTYTVNKNVNFYAVQAKEAKIILHKNDGTVYSTTTLAEGTDYALPSVKNAVGYTFMGWSDRAYQFTNPMYEPEMKVTAKGQIDLYAVVFKKSMEENIPVDSLPQMNNYKYKRVIFVGGSRTQYMAQTLKNIGANTNGINFICQEGKGLDWFKTTGSAQLLNLVKDGSNSILQKPTAVIFNLGINDLKNLSSYVLYLNSLSTTLESKGCKLFYMSVNPVNRSMLSVSGKSDRSEAEVRNFNKTIRTSLAGKYRFIDAYAHLKDTGYGFDSGKGTETGVDDGLHYTMATYKRIYKYCMMSL